MIPSTVSTPTTAAATFAAGAAFASAFITNAAFGAAFGTANGAAIGAIFGAAFGKVLDKPFAAFAPPLTTAAPACAGDEAGVAQSPARAKATTPARSKMDCLRIGTCLVVAG